MTDWYHEEELAPIVAEIFEEEDRREAAKVLEKHLNLAFRKGQQWPPPEPPGGPMTYCCHERRGT